MAMPQLFEGWITLSMEKVTIQWISVNKTNHAIQWIVIYPVDSDIQTDWTLRFEQSLILHYETNK